MSATVIGFLVMLSLSTLIGWWSTRSKSVDKMIKVMLFMLYFWVSAFIQLTIFALMYQFGLLDSVAF